VASGVVERVARARFGFVARSVVVLAALGSTVSVTLASSVARWASVYGGREG
jgi:hypothetical protein